MPVNHDQIYNMLESGLPLETIYSLVGLSDEEIKLLDEDLEYKRKVRFYLGAYERNLLDRLDHIMDINESKGISTEVRWLLSRRFSDRWGSKQVIFNQNPGVLPPPTVGLYTDDASNSDASDSDDGTDTDTDLDEGDD